VDQAHITVERCTILGGSPGASVQTSESVCGRINGSIIGTIENNGDIVVENSLVARGLETCTDGGNRRGSALFEGKGNEPYRPQRRSPAAGIATAPPDAVDLAGRPRPTTGATAGALEVNSR
jgi:hypothetical protein